MNTITTGATKLPPQIDPNPTKRLRKIPTPPPIKHDGPRMPTTCTIGHARREHVEQVKQGAKDAASAAQVVNTTGATANDLVDRLRDTMQTAQARVELTNIFG